MVLTSIFSRPSGSPDFTGCSHTAARSRGRTSSCAAHGARPALTACRRDGCGTALAVKTSNKTSNPTGVAK